MICRLMEYMFEFRMYVGKLILCIVSAIRPRHGHLFDIIFSGSRSRSKFKRIHRFLVSCSRCAIHYFDAG